MTEAQMQEVHEGQQEIADARAVDALLKDIEHLTITASPDDCMAAGVTVRVTSGTTVRVLQQADESVGECVRRAMEMSRMTDTEYGKLCLYCKEPLTTERDQQALAHRDPKAYSCLERVREMAS